MSWREQGACWDTRTLMFFVDRSHPAKQAKAVCATCPVTAECLDYALENRLEWGIWGGLAPRERRVVRKQRAAA